MSLEELDEHERSERAREWVRKNIGSIALGLVAGLGLIYGFDRWNQHRHQTAGQAGDEYRAYAEAVTKSDATAIATLGKRLRDQYPDSPYAAMTALNDAAASVKAGKIDDAIASLNWAEAHPAMPEVKAVAQLRRARLLLSQNKADEALNLAKSVELEGFKAQAAEIRGDALMALKRPGDAAAAYDEALVGIDSGSPHRSLVEMKRNDLADVKAGS